MPTVKRNLPGRAKEKLRPPTRQRMRNRRRRTYHHGNVPDAMVKAAVKIIAKRGVAGVTMLEAARKIGVSPETPRRHFPGGVPDLLLAVAREGFHRLAAEYNRLREARRSEPKDLSLAEKREYLSELGIAYVEFAQANPAYFRVMFSPEVDVGSLELSQELQATFGRLVEAVDAIGPAPEARANFIVFAWTVVHGMSTLINDRVLDRMGLTSDTSMDGLRLVIDSVVNSEDFWTNLGRGAPIATINDPPQ